MTLVILGLDALDAALVDRFDLEHVPLATSGEMETFANMKDIPLTQEVWPTVATGLEPAEHGVTEGNTSEWDNPLVDLASRFTWVFATPVRNRLGDIAESTLGSEYSIAETDVETVFDGPGRLVHDWPGVESSHWLQRAWETGIPEDGKTKAEFKRDLISLATQQLAWCEEMLQQPSTLVATHVHLLDMGGHVFSDDEANLRALYEWVDDWVGHIRAAMDEDDELLILSDHGMVTTFCPEEGADDGDHSWRAFSASTATSRPTSVYDCRDWIETRLSAYDPESDEVAIPEQQLEDLGYI
jgi:predicted AlkP superfamily pyrophosphatase or phosphodiesterase